MVMCFAPDCRHYSEKHRCKFYVFPKDGKLKKRWIKLLRRQDKNPSKNSRVCSCHFKDEKRENLPTLYRHNIDKKNLLIESPKPKRKCLKESVSSNQEYVEIPSTSSIVIEDNSTLEPSPVCMENYPIASTCVFPPSSTTVTGNLSPLPSTSEVVTFLCDEKAAQDHPYSKLSNIQNQLIHQGVQVRLCHCHKPRNDVGVQCTEPGAQVSAYINKIKLLETKLLQVNKLSYTVLCVDEKQFHSFTGMPKIAIFDAVFKLVKPLPKCFHANWAPSSISEKDQLLMTLMKLRVNPTYSVLGYLFGYSTTTITNIFITWLETLHQVLYKQLMKNIPSRVLNRACLPSAFSGFSNCRIIIDCTDFNTEIPQQMDKQRRTFSNYKHRNTFKGLLGIAPNGVVTFVSDLYPGSISDKLITLFSGLLKQMEPGDLVLADKGFLIRDILPPGVSVNIPPFLSTPQFTPSQIRLTNVIAKARIHVERAIRRTKTFRIMQFIPHNFFPHASKIFQVCAALTNLQNPLIKEVEPLMI